MARLWFASDGIKKREVVFSVGYNDDPINGIMRIKEPDTILLPKNWREYINHTPKDYYTMRKSFIFYVRILALTK